MDGKGVQGSWKTALLYDLVIPRILRSKIICRLAGKDNLQRSICEV